MELGPQNHNGDGLLGLNSIIVVYMDPLGFYGVSGPLAFGLPGSGVVWLRCSGLLWAFRFEAEVWMQELTASFFPLLFWSCRIWIFFVLPWFWAFRGVLMLRAVRIGQEFM